MKKKQLKKGEQPKKGFSNKKEKRTHRLAFHMNDTEYKAVQRHLKKYKITNKSNWLRLTILAHIWQKLGEDLPMLFDEKEMRPESPIQRDNYPLLFAETEMRYEVPVPVEL